MFEMLPWFEPPVTWNLGVALIKNILKRCSALVAVSTLLQPVFMPAAMAQYAASVTGQPANTDALVSQYYISPAADPQLNITMMTSLLRRKIKYVFVIFNENESFDHEYGTFPGANGLYSTYSGNGTVVAQNPATNTQTYTDSYTGATVQVTPFLLSPNNNSSFEDSMDHSHVNKNAVNGDQEGLVAKLRVVNGVATMTGFAQDEFDNGYSSATAAAEAKGRQRANMIMSHIDCNTIPFFWFYASRFTLFDNIFATEDTPSSPNAIALIMGQSGETQWVKHPGPNGGFQTQTAQPVSGTFTVDSPANSTETTTTFSGTGTLHSAPILTDYQPYWGSPFDTTVNNREPYGSADGVSSGNIAVNLTSATVPLTAMGTSIKTILATDQNPSTNEADIQNDIPAILSHGTAPVSWRWYQLGYDVEPTDNGQNGTTAGVASHRLWVSHHEGPQYIGYIANDTTEQANLKGEGDFFADLANNNLPANGGIFYLRGGYGNLQGLTPNIVNTNYPNATANNAPAGLTATDIATINAAKYGDDDHPAYSDRQISEAMTARTINAIASNPTLWSQSAIIITYDESDGFYDHVPPQILAYGPDSLPMARGVRIPLLVISPYARVHAVSHAIGDHNAVIETINTIFNLPALSSLPDEASALAAGNSQTFNQYGPAGFQQQYLGPRDTNSATTDSLLSAFSPARLRGTAPALPGSYAMITTSLTPPHFNGQGCAAIGITPTVPAGQTADFAPPANLNPMYSTLPQYNSPSP